jgi:predicted nucleotidyltransferase
MLYFLLNPREEVYLAQIVNSTGKALLQIQRTLKRLVECGLVQKTLHHNRMYYKADQNHIAYEDIRRLCLKAKIFSDMFREDIERLNERGVYGFIYGSVAKGTNSAESDIDIFFIGNLTYSDVATFLFKLGRELAQEVNGAVFTTAEFLQALKDKNSFVAKVLQEPKIWLFGDKSEFEKIYC